MSSYEEKKQARIERYEELAQRKEKEATATWNEARKMASVIPFGQPILVGHHSEQRDRNYRKRIHNKHQKAYDTQQTAEHYRQKAAAAKSNRAISSDDPEAVTKLKAKIASAERKQEIMKAANKILRSKKMSDAEKIAELGKIGITEATAYELMHPKWDYYGKGFASFQLSNNNANIRRMRERLTELEKAASREHKETDAAEGLKVVHNVDENRVQLIFEAKPSAECRQALKSHGFRWSRYNSAWQRQLNNNGIYAAGRVVEWVKANGWQ